MSTRVSLRKMLLAAVIAGISVLSTVSVHAAGMMVANGGFGGRMEIESQDVVVTVNNGVAVTEVTQVFQNKENRIVEALYTFPVPKKASVSNFSMWIGGKEMIGEVLEKKRAREIYESYKKKRVDPGLLEQKDYKTFEMRIFPIPAKGKQKVKVTYYQELDVDHDLATYVYPLATTVDGVISSRTTGRFSLDMKVKSEIPITMMDSPSHENDFAIVRHNENFYQASLEVKEGDLNKDAVLAYKLKRPKTGFDMIFSKEGRENGYFCLTLAAGKELDQLQKGMDYVFVLDISGSMRNDSKLRISRESLLAFVNELDEKDRFDMISFNVSAESLFGKLQAAADAPRKQANEFLESRNAKGGTDLRPAIKSAYNYSDPDRQLNVVILSDGMTEQGSVSNLMQLIKERPRNTRVFCVGVGNDVNRPLLEDVAEQTGGLASFLSRGDNFKRQAKSFRRKLMRPAVSDISFDFGGGVYDVEPKGKVTLYHGMPIRLYGRYKDDGDVKVTVKGDIMGRTFSKSTMVNFPSRGGSNPEIERMWAWHKIQRLLKEADRGGSREKAVTDEIVRLGEGYSIVSEYTSFLVLENDNEYKRWKIERKNALRLERDRKSRLALQQQFEKMRERAPKDLGPANEEARKSEAKPVQQAVRPQPQSQRVVNNNSNSRPRRSRSRSFDLFPSGGGAVSPLWAMVLAAFGSVIGFVRRKRK